MASKSRAPPAIQTIVHKNEEIVYLYIDTKIEKPKLKRTLIDSGIYNKTHQSKTIS